MLAAPIADLGRLRFKRRPHEFRDEFRENSLDATVPGGFPEVFGRHFSYIFDVT